MSIVRQRHETVNRRLKQWRILKGVFRHDISFHHVVFSAVAVITQVAISKGEPLFQVNYTDNYYVSDEEEELVDDEDHISDVDGEEEGEASDNDNFDEYPVAEM